MVIKVTKLSLFCLLFPKSFIEMPNTICIEIEAASLPTFANIFARCELCECWAATDARSGPVLGCREAVSLAAAAGQPGHRSPAT